MGSRRGGWRKSDRRLWALLQFWGRMRPVEVRVTSRGLPACTGCAKATAPATFEPLPGTVVEFGGQVVGVVATPAVQQMVREVERHQREGDERRRAAASIARCVGVTETRVEECVDVLTGRSQQSN